VHELLLYRHLLTDAFHIYIYVSDDVTLNFNSR